MKKFLLLTVCTLVVFTFSSCKDSNAIEEKTSTENISVEETAEPAAGTDLSVDEIVALYNDTIRNTTKVTRIYTHAAYENLDLSSDVFESAAKTVLEKTVKNDDVEYTSTQKSEIENILPNPCLDKAMIKSYTNTDGKISLILYDVENPTDEGCIKFYPVNFILQVLSDNNLSVENMKMTYTDCKIDFTVNEGRTVTDLSYSWCVHASGNFELLFKTQSFGIDINVGESYKF